MVYHGRSRHNVVVLSKPHDSIETSPVIIARVDLAFRDLPGDKQARMWSVCGLTAPLGMDALSAVPRWMTEAEMGVGILTISVVFLI